MFFSGIGDYFSLAAENKFLSEQNKVLLERLTALEKPGLNQNPAELKKNFEYINGRILKNSFTGYRQLPHPFLRKKRQRFY